MGIVVVVRVVFGKRSLRVFEVILIVVGVWLRR